MEMVKHEIKVIDVKDNEVLEELNEPRDEEQSNDIINDDTTNEIEEEKKEDIIEPAQTVKEKKTRVKKEQIITDEEVKPAKEKKPRVKKEKLEETKPIEIPEPVEIPEPEPEPILVEEAKSKKKQKILELVTCDKCNREMTAKTLKYSHESICPATNPPKEKVKKIKKEYVQQPIQVVENPTIPVLKCEILSNTLNARREKMNQKEENV